MRRLISGHGFTDTSQEVAKHEIYPSA
jgi:hypothetical protein